MDTKKLGIQKSSQFRVTIEDFGKVQVPKGASEIAGCIIGKFKKLTFPTARTRFGIPQKKKSDITNMLPFLPPEARDYFEELLA
ncbi:hypothetical protein J6590_090934 [Homalodisca vitripennis]|nr:hypothetical protein J6590_090934 [Homalodisca vitripennis]